MDSREAGDCRISESGISRYTGLLAKESPRIWNLIHFGRRGVDQRKVYPGSNRATTIAGLSPP